MKGVTFFIPVLFIGWFAFNVEATIEADFATAIEQQDLTAVKSLVENGASVETALQDGEVILTPLIKAAASGALEIAAYLIDKGANLSATDSSGNTPLLSAVKAQQAEVVQLLTSRNARVDQKDTDQFTALAVAASAGSDQIVQTLVNAGADLHEEIFGLTTLMLATTAGKESTVQLLIQLGAPVNQVSTVTGKTALFSAINTGKAEIVQVLINHQANVNFRTEDGETPLKTAQQGNQPGLVTILQTAGALQ